MRLLTCLILLSIVSNLSAFDHTHQSWTEILKRYVSKADKQTFVDYQGILKEKNKLGSYLENLSKVSKSHFSSFNKKQRLAFLINAYNAFTVKLIIDHYPVDSIKDLGSLFSSPWKKEFFTLLEEKMHLDNIEHNLIRKNFNEPRIHYAVNCASISCPSLLEVAFTGNKLEQQLKLVEKNFLTNSKKNYIDKKNKTLYVSKIFKWYGDDFIKNHKGLLKYFESFYNTSLKDYEIEYLDYNWQLNIKK